MLTKKKLESMEVTTFIDYLVQKGLTKCYVVNSSGNITSSSTLFEDFSKFITDIPDYDNHDGIFFQVDIETKSLFIAAIHRTIRGNAQGGSRLKSYHLVKDIFTDALRLSKGMTEKNSSAELWWGGGKSVIHPNKSVNKLKEDDALKKTILENFGRFIASLNGLYVCAADMNTDSKDMEYVHRFNRHTTCIPKRIGGSSNPGAFTAKGVFNGILAGVHFIDGTSESSNIDLSGKHIIIQGAGSVGFPVLEQVIKAGGKVSIAEMKKETYDKINDLYSKYDVTLYGPEKASLDKIYSVEADVFSPNAIGATINSETIKKLKVKLIAGGANNQLQNAELNAKELHDRGILYVPDFIINRMGIINCANEQYGYLRSEIENEANRVYDSILELLDESQKRNVSPYFQAIENSVKLSKIPNPLFGHRGKHLIQDLIDRGWANLS